MLSVHEASQYQDHLNGPIFIPYDILKSSDFLEAANEVVQEESRAQIFRRVQQTYASSSDNSVARLSADFVKFTQTKNRPSVESFSKSLFRKLEIFCFT